MLDLFSYESQSTIPSESAYARDGDLIGAPIWRRRECISEWVGARRLIYGHLEH